MKKKNLIWSMMVLLAMGTTMTSCSSDDGPAIIDQPVTLTIDMPLGLENVEVLNDVTTLTDVKSGETYVASNAIQKTANGFVVSFNEVAEGTYNVQSEGKLSFTVNGVAGTTNFNFKQENVAISRAAAALKATINTFTAKGGFVISEVFFTGTTTPEGKQYTNDQYVKITNNSDVTLYADSLAFVESSFLSVNNYAYEPDINADTLAVGAVYMIPGTGKSVPVEPGQTLTLAVNAINHLEGNTNSLDLRGADFEFYDISSNPNYNDVDNENVPNLDKWFCYTATLYTMHNRGFKAMALVKMQETKETWLEKYVYEGNYVMTFNDNAFTMKVNNTYKIPMTWVVDGINLSVEEEWQWNVLPANIDSGWTYCGRTLNDKSRYSKAVIRKQGADGKYIDTNNSTSDFEAEAVPSLLAK